MPRNKKEAIWEAESHGCDVGQKDPAPLLRTEHWCAAEVRACIWGGLVLGVYLTIRQAQHPAARPNNGKEYALGGDGVVLWWE